jgi:hypothetical protein
MRVYRWARNVACIGEMRNSYKVLVRKPEGKRLLETSVSKYEGNIKMDV